MKPLAKALLFFLLASLGYAAGQRLPRTPSSALTDRGVEAAESPHPRDASRQGDGAELGFPELRPRLQELASASSWRWGASYFLEGKRPGQGALELERIFARATRDQLVAFFAEEEDPSKTGPAILAAAYGRLAELSPEEAVAIWTDQFRRTGNGDGAEAIARTWGSTDPAATERWIDGLTDPKLKVKALFGLLDVALETAPDLVERRVGEIRGEDFNFTFSTSHLVARLARQAPPEKLGALAERVLAETQDNWEYQNQLVALLEVWGERDGPAMMAWLLAQKPGRLMDHVVPRAVEARSKADPAAFLREIGPSLGENEAIGEIVGQAWLKWLAREPEGEAIRWLEKHGDHVRINQRSMWINRITDAQQADAALSQLAGLADVEIKTQAARAILHHLGQVAPKSALAHAHHFLSPGRETDMFLAGTLSGLARSGEPSEALDWALANLEAGEGKNDAVRWVMSEWVNSSPAEAARRAGELPEKLRNEAFNGIAYRWAERAPEQMLDYLAKVSDPDAHTALARHGFWSLGYHRGGEAHLAKALALPHEAMRTQAVEGLFGGWSRANLESSAEALGTMERGPIRDAAVAAFVSSARWTDREAAVVWSLDITDPGKRREVAMQQSRYWLNADRKAAEKWIAASESLPAEWKAELLKPAK